MIKNLNPIHRLLSLCFVLVVTFNSLSMAETSKDNASTDLYIQFDEELDKYLSEPSLANIKPVLKILSNLLKENPSLTVEKLSQKSNNLSKLSIATIDKPVGSIYKSRLWSFNGKDESNIGFLELIKQVKEPHKSRSKPLTKDCVLNNFLIELPKNYKLENMAWYLALEDKNNEAQKNNNVELGKLAKNPKSKSVTTKPEFVLVVIGCDEKRQKFYLKGFRLNDSNLISDPQVFECLPPNLSKNFNGSVTLNDKTIVLNLVDTNPKLNNANIVNTYSLTLYWVNNKFSFNPQKDPSLPSYPAYEFMNAVNIGNSDYAKSWLQDPNLMSIIKYAGLVGEKPGLRSEYKLISLNKVNNLKDRFRIITGKSDDLIIDVQKIKLKWYITSIFLAPGDSFMRSITQNTCHGSSPNGLKP